MEVGLIGGKKGVGVMRSRRRVGLSGRPVVVFLHASKVFLSQTSLGIGLVRFGSGLRTPK